MRTARAEWGTVLKLLLLLLMVMMTDKVVKVLAYETR